ncbi:hypothetical protein K488DRAFT_67230 [Vararia minispora EC-137]|uniref:Uncharacterized protein n=1 Tax=Vararia minispora EC-137 TaxID=1314806 RepID=A0ACB8QZD6_9AGAM|nr:hypothetical protein K488DRAFT_67230 [Vararia minispora EC-137]
MTGDFGAGAKFRRLGLGFSLSRRRAGRGWSASRRMLDCSKWRLRDSATRSGSSRLPQPMDREKTDGKCPRLGDQGPGRQRRTAEPPQDMSSQAHTRVLATTLSPPLHRGHVCVTEDPQKIKIGEDDMLPRSVTIVLALVDMCIASWRGCGLAVAVTPRRDNGPRLCRRRRQAGDRRPGDLDRLAWALRSHR